MNLLPLRDCTELLGDPGALKARFDRQGTLFFRRLAEPEEVAPLTALVRSQLEGLGFVSPEGAPLRPTPEYEDPDYVTLQKAAYPSREMDRLRRHPRLLEVLHALLGPQLGMGRGDIVRLRGRGARTRPHQDRHYLPGDDALIAAWFPLEPCPIEHGPIAVLPGSHHGGLLPHAGPHRSDFGVVPVPEGPWAGAPLEPGDVLLFSDFTVHQGLPTTADVFRISADFRYSAGTGGPRRRG